MKGWVRVRASEAVAEHVLELLFDGELREGDRIALDALAESLGVSREPVREAMMQLERDGLVRIEHYRGAYVGAFNVGTVREAFGLYGMLNAVTSRQVAADRPADVLAELDAVWQKLRTADHVEEFESLAREVRRIINVYAAGPHLRSLLRTFSGFVPAAARFSIQRAMDDERAAVEAELAAVRDGDPERAGQAVIEHLALTADNAIATLRERGVLGDEDVAAPAPEHLAGIAAQAQPRVARPRRTT